MPKMSWLAALCVSVSTGLAALALSAGASVPPTPSVVPAAAVTPVVVPVTVKGGQGAHGGADPMVEVRVGGSGPVPVFLDTGSSGLHIFSNAVATGPGSGVTVTSQPSNITYAGGYTFTGVVASAVIRVGSQATAAAVPFALVNAASCKATKPACAAAGGISGYESSRGTYGILGIGTQSSPGDVISPLLGMPGSLADRWSLHLTGTTGALVLGAPPRATTPLTTFTMQSLGTVAGRSLWDDSGLPLCVTVGTTQACTKGLFDSGTASFQIAGPVLGQAPIIPGTKEVVSNLPVALSQPGSTTPFWTFTTGTAKSQDLVRLGPQRRSFVNTGVGAFYDFVVLYDEVAGTVSLYR